MSSSSHRCAVLIAAAFALAAPAASAQVIDYDTFQQMFGEPVTAAATGKPQRVSQAPVDISIVTHDDILNSGLDNIPDILRFVAGLDVRSYGQGDAAVGIRGLNSALNPNVLVLLDGRQVYSDDYGLTIWSAIPVALSEIQQIEVIKGPNAALYGFNAVSGVINIVTRNPLLVRQNSLVVEAGTQNQALGEAVATVGRPGAWGVRLTATGFDAQQFRSTSPMPDGRVQNGHLALDGRFKLSDRIELDLSGSLGTLRMPYEVDVSNPSRYLNQINSVRGILQADLRRSGLWRLDAYRNEQRTNLDVLGTTFHWRQATNVMALSDLLALGKNHTLRPSLEYRDVSISSLATFEGRLGYRVASGSLMWNWHISPNLSLTNALRIDSLALYRDRPLSDVFDKIAPFRNRDITVPSFNSGLVASLSANDIVRLGAARATRLPSLIDFGLAAEIPQGPITTLRTDVSGDSMVEPTTLDSLDLGYDHRIPAIDGALHASVFANFIHDLIGSPLSSGSLRAEADGYVLQTRNFGSTSNYGTEVTIGGQIAPNLHGKLGYAFNILDNGNGDGADHDAIALNPRQTPQHVVIGGLDYHHGRWSTGFDLRWQSSYEDRTLNAVTGGVISRQIENYVTANLHAAVSIGPHFNLSGIVEQLNASHIIETGGSRAVERRALLSARLSL